MRKLKEIIVKGIKYEGIEIPLPKTTLLIIKGSKGFIMCGALNVEVYNSPQMLERNVLCASVRGVKSFDDMLNANIYDLTKGLKALGAYKGMRVDEALAFIS